MTNRQTVSFLIHRFRDAGIRPDTRHGQNFLIDLNLVRLLADSAGLQRRDVVLEVGTGTGSLTAMLAAEAAAVITVEISRELQQLASEELVDCDNVTMLHMDALKNKNRFQPALLETIVQQMNVDPHRQLKLVANLPYNIATPVISNLLLIEPVPVSMTVTIQKELADRIAARPNTKDYGALSVWVQSQCQVEVVRILPPTVFWPQPKIHSAILHIVLDPVRRAAIGDLAFFHTFSRSLFLHRRKFLRSGLLSAFKEQLDKPAVDAVMADMQLQPDARAEQLDVPQLLDLSQRIRQALPATGDQSA